MKTLETYVSLTLLVFGLTLLTLEAWAYPGNRHFIPEHYSNEMTVLDLGWKSSCQSNFVIENLDEYTAEIQVNLGKEIYKEDSIMGNGKRFYDLRDSLSFAKQLEKTVTMDDVALVTNKSKIASILIHC